MVSRKRDSNIRGICYEAEDEQYIIGYFLDKHHLKIEWRLPRKQFAKAYGWRLPESMQYALSILLGQSIHLLQREMRWDDWQRLEMRKTQEVTSLNFLYPISGSTVINREYFVKLTHFIAAKEHGSDVCCNVFRQLLEASRLLD